MRYVVALIVAMVALTAWWAGASRAATGAEPVGGSIQRVAEHPAVAHEAQLGCVLFMQRPSTNGARAIGERRTEMVIAPRWVCAAVGLDVAMGDRRKRPLEIVPRADAVSLPLLN